MIGDTAAISLLTGLPGAGKSLRIAEAISKLVDKGEHVYACNIEGLRIPGVTPFEDARKWNELPAGAILFVDEAQAFFPERRGGEPPEYVRMNMIRHEGIRLVLATQQPNYLDSYLRGLVGYHEHLLRRNGRQESFLFRENQVMDVVRQKLATIKRNYDHETFKFNPKYFECYDSAQTHTVKYRMPALVKKALLALPVVALLGGGAWFTVFQDSSLAKAADAPAEPTAAVQPSMAGASAASPNARQEVITTPEQYVSSLVPLVADVPWSAPAYVNRPVVSDPHYYCMSTENSCRCVTEQNTRVVIRDDVCREVARWGEPYNPHKQPSLQQQPQQERQDQHDSPRKPQAAEYAVTGQVGYSPGSRPDQFPRSPGYQGSSYTGPTSTL